LGSLKHDDDSAGSRQQQHNFTANAPTVFAPYNFNGRGDEWTANFTNLMLDLHYQPFGYSGNDTSATPSDYYNDTFKYASSFTRRKGGSNLLRADIVFWGWFIGGHHVLAPNWAERCTLFTPTCSLGLQIVHLLVCSSAMSCWARACHYRT
jgi:hypothetical protein